MKTFVGVALVIVVGALAVAMLVLLATGAFQPSSLPGGGGPAALSDRLGQFYFGTPQAGISVNGQGIVKSKPDLATLQVAVDVTNISPIQAQTEAATRMDAVMAKLKDLGIAADDIKTSQFSLSPQYSYGANRDQPTLTGYRVINSIAVTVRKLDTVGKVLDGVTSAGATRIDSVGFSVADPTPLQSQARAAAVKQAKARAEELAKAAGVGLGKASSISESTSGGTPIFAASAKGLGAAAVDTAITPGDLEIRVDVQMNFAIQ